MSNVDQYKDKWIITFTVMTGAVMSALDASIVNVALPYMRGSLNASVEEIAWVATSYILASVIVMPIIGLLSSRYGRRNFYIFSVFLFTVTSMLCGIAWDLPSMIIFRTLQGIGGGAIIPLSQAILREKFPPNEQGMAMGIFGLGVVLGPAIGPTLGGWLTDHYSWPWVYYINVPVGILNTILVMRYIHDPSYLKRERGRLDVLGLTLLTAGLGALQLMLEKGQEKDWFNSNYIIVLSVIAFFGLVFFVWRELTISYPAVELRLLKNVTFASGTMIGGTLGVTLYASLFLLPLFLQQTLGYSAYDAGLAMMPRSIAMAVTMPFVGKMYNRLGPKFLVGGGLAVTGFSFWQFTRFTLDIGYFDLLFPQILQGIGFGMIFVALSTVALASMDRVNMTAASGLYNVVRQVFGSVGIAMSATLLARSQSTHAQVMSEHLTPTNDIAGEWLDGLTNLFAQAGDIATAQIQAMKVIGGVIARQAAMLAYNDVYMVCAILFACSLPLILLLRDDTRHSSHDSSGDAPH